MKTTYLKLSLSAILLSGIFSCRKGEASTAEIKAYETTDSAAVPITDSISSAASIRVKDKQFIKTADVNMEVKDVYEATVSIEKSVQELGGFVTHSNLTSNVVSENTYNTSGEEAVLIKKYQTENTMQARVPSEKLSEFLAFINDKKLFLNSRVIHAEDVTFDIKYAEMEGTRIKKTGDNISKLKATKDKVELDDQNMSEGNLQKLANMNTGNDLKYSTIDLYIKEPQIRVAKIAVTNTTNIDNKYKFNFIYDAKNAFVEGFYLIQKIIVGLITAWPLLLIIAAVIYFLRKRKAVKSDHPKISES
ncbi:DUF4349 domain-containing protein [Chryseobacterium indologenes]|uniref:DUF4349 domain-containing protein n=1 Tax=Chryseobacterium indologenes TaxID=253 RepID=A0A0N0IWP3_CHRID|nr:DUF4349 domain-containing protein [Chryseobacterium indologenes]KPE51522.1 hypothetical protein AOB46_09695 [Chryseobacterium indologenes]